MFAQELLERDHETRFVYCKDIFENVPADAPFQLSGFAIKKLLATVKKLILQGDLNGHFIVSNNVAANFWVLVPHFLMKRYFSLCADAAELCDAKT